VLQPFMETLALEITRALQFFFTSTSHSQVDQIVLVRRVRRPSRPRRAGGQARGRRHGVANPFANMAASDRIRPRQLAQDAPMLLIATGLALGAFE
jgi:type IV pilus assembly protein PilM